MGELVQIELLYLNLTRVINVPCTTIYGGLQDL